MSSKNDSNDGCYEAIINFLKAICDISRLKMINSLKNGEKHAKHFKRSLGKSHSTISTHIKQLVEQDIVSTRIDGQMKYYNINNNQVFDVIAKIHRFVHNDSDYGDQVAAIAKLAELLAQNIPIDKLAISFLEYAKQLTQSEHGYVATIDPENGDLVSHTLTHMFGKDCEMDNQEQGIRFSKGKDGIYPSLWGHSLNTKEPFFTNFPRKHEKSSGNIPNGHVPLENFLSYPVIFEQELVGQIAVANSPFGYTDNDLEIIKKISNLYAIAINNHRLQVV